MLSAFGEQHVDGLDGGHLAAFEAAHGDVEDLDRPRHLQADQCLLDAGRRAWGRSRDGRSSRGIVEVERASCDLVAGAPDDTVTINPSSVPGRQGFAMRRVEVLLVAAFERNMGGDERAVLKSVAAGHLGEVLMQEATAAL
jgi:hypothetical protein